MLVLNGESAANSLTFTADGTRLIATRMGGIDVWTLPDGRLARTVEVSGVDLGQCSVAIQPDGDFAFVAGRVLTAVSLTVPDYGVYVRGADRFDRVVVSPDGMRVIAGTGDRRLHGYLFHTPRGEYDGTWEVGLHSHDEMLGTFVGNHRFVTSDWKQLIVRSVATGEVIEAHPHPAKFGAQLLASPDSTRLVGMSDTRLYVWKTSKLTKPKRVGAPRGEHFRAFAVHPTRPLLAAIQLQQAEVKFFDADSGKVVTRYDWRVGEMRSVTFSQDGALAAASSATGKIVVWDVD